MELVELAIGLGACAVAAPWAGKFALTGYQRMLKQYNEVNAERIATDGYKPIRMTRQEELSALVHRQEIAKNTAYAIQAEAALAVTEATIEKALSSGDLALAKQGIQLSLPSNGNAPVYQSEPDQGHLNAEAMRRLSAVVNQPSPVPMQYGGQPGSAHASPFRANSTDFFLGLIREASPRGTRDIPSDFGAPHIGLSRESPEVQSGELLGPDEPGGVDVVEHR